MRTMLTVAFIVCSAALSGAQERLADQLRKGIVQEEASQNLDKAIAAYKAIVAQYDQDRQTAATALYRLAECYRKTGKRDQAVAAYQRVVREFPDQAALVEPSRQQLASAYGITEPKLARSAGPTGTRGGVSEPEPAGRPKAARYPTDYDYVENALRRDLMARQFEVKAAERDMQAVQDKISDYQFQIKNGQGSADSTAYRQLMRVLDAARDRLELAQMNLQQAQHDYQAGTEQPRGLTPKSSPAGPREVTPESLKSMQIDLDVLQKELERSKKMVEVGQLSPLDYQELQARFEQAVLHYQQAVKSREASEVAARETAALNEKLAKSLEDEIALLKNWIDAAEKGVIKGYSADSPELLQRKRDLLELQRKLDQLRAPVKR